MDLAMNLFSHLGRGRNMGNERRLKHEDPLHDSHGYSDTSEVPSGTEDPLKKAF